MNDDDMLPALPQEVARRLDEILDQWSTVRRPSPHHVQALYLSIGQERDAATWWQVYWKQIGDLVAQSIVACGPMVATAPPGRAARHSVAYRPYLHIGPARG